MSNETLESIADEIKACTLCGLSQNRTQAVPGAGNPTADIMFIGEAPGFYEDKQGLPFVGASGRYLDELLQMIDLKREDVFITNIVRCRPPRNRDPLRSEIQACRPYLDRQIAQIEPKIIATLGRFSMAQFFDNAKISQIHGQPLTKNGRIYYPLYHPAAVLRSPALKVVMQEDFKRIQDIIANFDDYLSQQEDAPEEDPPPEPPQQLSLF
jgi:uracil-DNA glycosylase